MAPKKHLADHGAGRLPRRESSLPDSDSTQMGTGTPLLWAPARPLAASEDALSCCWRGLTWLHNTASDRQKLQLGDFCIAQKRSGD